MSYYYKLFWFLTGITTFLRLSVIGKLGLTVDEAHYWVYSKFLDLSYYDHPPMIGYIIKLFTDIFGINEFAVRLPSVIIFVLTSWLLFLCVKKLFNEKIAFIATILINILPVFSFLGAVVTIPDSPLSLFWMLSFYLFINIVETKEKKYWYLLGITIGFAFLSKYTAIMIYPSIILFLLCSKEHRFWFLKKELYLSMIISFIFFLPVVIWNIQNNWASFGFQLQHGFGKSLPSFSFTLFGRSIGAQAGYVSPFLFIFYCYVMYILIKDAFFKKQKDALIVASFSIPVLFFFNAIATFNEILPHWPAMGYLMLTIYAAYIINKFWDNSKFRKIIYFSCGFALFLDLIVPIHCMYKFIPIEPFLPQKEAEKVEYGIPKAEIVDVSNDLFGWKELSNEINKIYEAYPENNKPFLFTHKSYLASQIYFYTPDKRVYCFSDKIDAYDLWQRDISNLKKRDGLFITSNMFDFDNPEKVYPFSEFEQPVEVPVYRNNKLVKKFWITKCKIFNPQLLPEKYTANVIGVKKTIRQGLIDTDHAVFKFVNINLKNKFFDFIISNISFFDSKGLNPSMIIIIIVSLIILRKEQKNKFWILLAFIICTVIVASTINTFIKGLVERPRPLTVFGEGNINVFYEILHARSFPSGHTQFAFTTMMTMLFLIPKYWYIYLILAFATGFERMYAGCHFPLDVCCGAIEGIIISYIMVKIFKKIYKL
ncbi:MAG: glycosyltransferase family 39 protein [Elusimicrobia bacterium]|nr:glycosyltransferase family 39 protein [Elusimicrobiota bacterium]